MELVSNLPKPPGFFDPKAPAGSVTPPERPEGAPPEPAPAPNAPPPVGSGFTNSDLAFKGMHAVVGNYHGFNTYDIENAKRPKLVASIVCPGGQGDVSIYGNLLFMSVEQTRGRLDCGVQGVTTPVSVERFRGVRIFDISDVKNPKQVAAVQTCRGSHTHTLVPDKRDPTSIYLYGSGTSNVRSGEELAGCSGLKPEEDPNTSLFSIDVIKVPLKNPEKAAIVNRPRLFADPDTGSIAGLWAGGNHGEGTQKTRTTNQCHDITVYSDIGLAAGACSGNGILMDISDPQNPKRLDAVSDKGFAYWHSATFNNDGTKVIFTDEWGGGSAAALPRIRPAHLGRRRDLRRGRQEARAPGLLQDAGGAGRHRELRGPQRLADSRARPRHHGAVVVPGRRVGVRLHRLDQTSRDRLLRPRPDQPDRARHRRLLVVGTGTTAKSTAPKSRAASTCSGCCRAST